MLIATTENDNKMTARVANGQQNTLNKIVLFVPISLAPLKVQAGRKV